MLALEKQGLMPNENASLAALVVPLGLKAQAAAFKVLYNLRLAGYRADMDFAGRSLKAQMKQANKLGAKYAIIIGEDEVREKSVMLKNMFTSEQTKIQAAEVVKNLNFEVKD